MTFNILQKINAKIHVKLWCRKIIPCKYCFYEKIDKNPPTIQIEFNTKDVVDDETNREYKVNTGGPLECSWATDGIYIMVEGKSYDDES